MVKKKPAQDHVTGDGDQQKGPDQEISKKEAELLPSFIVGIGASAGGLEAFQEFFEHLRPDTGMAFVLVSHLDPTHKGYLPELISRFTRMQVVEITDGIQVRPNTVYLIPPNADLSILHGNLSLLEPARVQGPRLPIDHFFRDLASDLKERSIGIILSGMGTDGTLGIKAIKENMGLVMVQDPASAKFNGMPQSAVASGLADYIATVSELPKNLIEFTSHITKMPKEVTITTHKELTALQKIFILIRSKTGHDFSLYKKNTILRRVERRMRVHQLGHIADYVRFLQENPQEVEILFHELLIGVTNFFREPDSWKALKDHILPGMIQSRPDKATIRAWVIGCATGEEAYSLAMVLREVLDAEKPGRDMKIQIFATDIYREVLDAARQGVYPANIVSDISPDRLERFFIQEGDQYRIKKEIRELVIFAEQDIIQDPPFTKLDVVSCRNLFIYFTPELQKKILPLLYYSLLPGGILFLGSAETVGESGVCFKVMDTKWKIFVRRELSLHERPGISFPSSPVSVPGRIEIPCKNHKETTIPALAQHILLEHYTPAAVLMTAEGDILYFHGRTGKYLEHFSGKANLNIYAMAPEGLRLEIGDAVKRADREGTDIVMKDLVVQVHGTVSIIDLIVKPIRKPDELRDYLMVVFDEHPVVAQRKQIKKGKKGVTVQDGTCPEPEDELRLARARLQRTTEEMEATREEQKSINEELQSTNEELQSTNEELNTSKEELQSLNEELTTVNSELEMKIGELSRSHDDMENMLKGTDIAMLFLDMQLNIRKFTKPVTKIFKLLAHDIGRPITDLVTNLTYDRIGEDVREVLATLERKELQVENRNGEWFVMRILPYRTSENLINGAVITFSDITTIKSLERSLIDARDYSDSIINTIREPLIVLDSDLHVISASRSFYHIFRLNAEETAGKTIYSIGNNQWDIPELRRLLEEIIPKNSRFEDYKFRYSSPGIGDRDMSLNARKIKSGKPGEELILLVMEISTESAEDRVRKKPGRRGSDKLS